MKSLNNFVLHNHTHKNYVHNISRYPLIPSGDINDPSV